MPISRPRRATSRLTLTLAGAALAAAACGGSSTAAKANSAPAATSGTTTAGAAITLAVHTGGKFGSYLTDSRGRSLYMFAADTAGKSACTGSCATYWPPLVGTPAKPASSAVRRSSVATISRNGGAMQVTYAGHPLYLYVGDGKPGDTKGQGLNLSGGKWWLVDPAGNAIQGSSMSTPSGSGSGSSSGYGGYGNG